MLVDKLGDLLKSGCNVICHQTNCQGVMGSGIALQIRTQFPKVYKTFLDSYKQGKSKLGEIDVVQVEDKYIVNMYSQNKYLPRGVNHTSYDAFRACLRKIKERFINERENITIGFPANIGCGLAGGDWSVVRDIIDIEFKDWRVEIWKF